MSQMDLHDAVSSTRSINISGESGSGFIILQPQISPPTIPTTGCKLYADGNNNISWENAQGNIFTLNVVSSTASRTWTMPNSSSELATVDSLALKEDKSKKGQPLGYASLGEDGKVPSGQLPSSVSGFSPSVVCLLYATCTILPQTPVEAITLTTTPPVAFASAPGFEPNVESELSVDATSGDFNMNSLGSVYEFKIDTCWVEDAESGERRIVKFIPLNGDLQTDQISYREELGLISSTYKQSINCDAFVNVYALGASGGFSANVELSAPNATTNRTVDVRIRVIKWQ
ncbi:Hypothetical protein PACV_14 [Pacmanvirus A23]|uniref:Hypothetical protein n=1 Tax=Pacmanvirus A23 TaxID=1932881 RepID=UPI000A0952A4|nr:Hypothetical protein B9W72_gp014 [Pacmanvirus A23]SIP85731.1 Hypothetical protein PACV_14 [Pacmanvirus A23]